jgi:hypothetical protein
MFGVVDKPLVANLAAATMQGIDITIFLIILK